NHRRQCRAHRDRSVTWPTASPEVRSGRRLFHAAPPGPVDQGGIPKALRRSRSDGGRSSRKQRGLDDCPTTTTHERPADGKLPDCKQAESPARVVYFTCRRRAFHAAGVGSTGNDQASYWSRDLISIGLVNERSLPVDPISTTFGSVVRQLGKSICVAKWWTEFPAFECYAMEQKDREQRYQVAKDSLIDLRRLKQPSLT